MLPVVLHSRTATPAIRAEVKNIISRLTPEQLVALSKMNPEQARVYLGLPAPVNMGDLGWINFVIQAAVAVASAAAAKKKKKAAEKKAKAEAARAAAEAAAAEAEAKRAEDAARAAQQAESARRAKALSAGPFGGADAKTWAIPAGLIVGGLGLVLYLTRRK